MNTSSTSPMPIASDPEAVMKLECPQCQGQLNMRRKHIGVAGKCVHCGFPVTAIELASGEITLVATESLKKKEEPVAADVEVNSETPPASPAIDESTKNPPSIEEGVDMALAGSPFPHGAVITQSGVPGELTTDSAIAEDPPAKNSGWGFPEEAGLDSKPLPESSASEQADSFKNFQETPGFPAFGSVVSTNAEKPVESVPPFPPLSEESPFKSDSSMFSEGPGTAQESVPDTSEVLEIESASEVNEQGQPVSEFPGIDQTAVFSNKEPETDTVVEEAPASGDLASESEASEDGEEMNQPGFAESLFGGSGLFDEGQVEASSPFGQSPNEGAAVGSPLFAQPEMVESGPVGTPSTPTESEEEVVLDGDGRPMKPMSEEEKEQFGKDMMRFGDYHKRSKWPRRILKFFVTIAVFSGLGYAAWVFMPDEWIGEYKEKIVNWFEPGSVLFELLPFELTQSEGENGEGETEVKIKVFDGFNQLNNDLNEYLDAAEDNLNSTMSEGASLPERERQENMEAPELPKLPFKLPGMGGGGE
ncbi:MAG: hypothetical protein AAGA96_05230 [Verrucomicrobiota bacterium]